MYKKFKNPDSKLKYEKLLEKYEFQQRKLLFPYSERKKIRETIMFADTNNLWNDNSFNSKKNIGLICELTKKFHNSFEERSFENWEKYYLENEKSFLDIVELSQRFKTKCEENKIAITDSEALNYCYIRIIDESYIGYQREYYTIDNLKRTYPNSEFEFASAEDDMECGIDIALFKDGNIIGGFQVKSPNALKRGRVENENNKRFIRCKAKYGFEPVYIESTENGEFSEKIKQNIDNYIKQQEAVLNKI